MYIFNHGKIVLKNVYPVNNKNNLEYKTTKQLIKNHSQEVLILFRFCKRTNSGTDTIENGIGIQTDSAGTIPQASEPAYRSQYTRQIAAMDIN